MGLVFLILLLGIKKGKSLIFFIGDSVFCLVLGVMIVVNLIIEIGFYFYVGVLVSFICFYYLNVVFYIILVIMVWYSVFFRFDGYDFFLWLFCLSDG